MHPDDRFHPPTTDDPYWTETCWFTFAIPEHGLSGQFYPFFRPNQRVCAAGVFFWDAQGHLPWNVRYGKNFWHLPMPEQDLTDIRLPNGIHYRCLEPLQSYALHYDDPDGDDIEVRLRFDAICPPNYLMDSHLDQPGRYTGTVRLGEQVIAVDSFGMRDRSWGKRDQFGTDIHHSTAHRGGYSYATADERNGFHAITMAFADDQCIVIHGYYLRDGEYAKLASGLRTVLARDPATGCSTHVRLEATDTLGRRFVAEAHCLNRIGLHLNPNLFTWNCLAEWRFGDARGYGEDHDNWSATAARHFFRRHAGWPAI